MRKLCIVAMAGGRPGGTCGATKRGKGGWHAVDGSLGRFSETYVDDDSFQLAAAPYSV